MAVEMFLDIKGVKGESKASGFVDKIDIFSFSFGASNPSQSAVGGGMGAGKVSLSSISFQKVVDNATPELFHGCCTGTHYDTATITVREAGGDNPVSYLVIDLGTVMVDSISWGGASGGDKPSESLSLAYSTIKITYTDQDAHGKGQKGPEFGWNIKANTKL